MKYEFTVDSFGCYGCPKNIDEVIDNLNEELKRRIGDETDNDTLREISDQLWKDFCFESFDAGAIW